jgi:hypothetical protein
MTYNPFSTKETLYDMFKKVNPEKHERFFNLLEKLYENKGKKL